MADGSVAPRRVLALPAIQSRPLFGFVFWGGIALLVVNVLVSTAAARRISLEHEQATHAQETLTALWRLDSRLADAESAERGYVLTGSEEYLAPWATARPEVERLLVGLESLAVGDPDLQAHTSALRESIVARMERLVVGVQRRQEEGFESARGYILTGKGLEAMAAVRSDFAALERELQQRADEANDRAHRSTGVARTTFAVANTAAGVMLALLFLFMRRHEATRERAAAVLRQGEERLRMVVDNAPVVLFALDKDGVIQIERGRGLSTIGMTPMHNVGLRCEDVWKGHPTIPDNVRRGLSGEAFSELVEIHGTVFETSYRPLRDDKGEVSGLLGIALDVTERLESERKLREATEDLERRVEARTAELEAANKELESFSYSVSHDLRAPLRSIDGFGAAIEEECGPALSPVCRTYMGRLRSATRRMAQLIEDLLKLSRVTRAGLHRETIDLSTLARGILEELAHADPGREVRVRVDDGLVAEGDSHLVRILLDNLLNNAWKFTSKTDDAEIRFTRDGDAFAVSDNGAGFDMAYVHRLFGPFQRLHGVDEFEGTGIGLATVQRIVARHGGRVWAEGEPGKGATFRFTLPVG
jgi:PAS domain S-box-containing protein